MHVLIIPSWYPADPQDMGGSFFREQAIAMARRVEHVGLIFPALRSLKWVYRSSSVPKGLLYEDDNGVHTYRWGAFNWTPRIPVGIYRQWMMHGMSLFEAYVQRHGLPDVIHAHCMLFAGALAVRIKERFGIPVVVTEHSTGYGRPFYGKFEMATAVSVAAQCDALLAVSANSAEVLQSLFSHGKHPWRVLPNIVNGTFLDHPLRQLGKQSIFTFINVALLRRVKRQDILIRAFAHAFAQAPDVRLIIAGAGHERRQLTNLVHELGMDAQVSLVGNVERQSMPALLAEANAFVLSSELETFGVVLVEALAMGLPVVATKCGGPNEIVRADDGILVPVNDVDALALAMRKMWSDADSYDPQHIRSACAERFSETTVCARLIETYVAVTTKFVHERTLGSERCIS